MKQSLIEEILDVHQLITGNRALYGDARMEDPPNPPTPDPPKQDPPQPDPSEKQLPQSRVNEIVTAETTKAKQKALEDLAKDLGVSIEDAKRIVKERKDADEKNRTDLEREQAARTAAEKDRDEKVTASQRELHEERSDRALIAAGAPDEDSKLQRLRGMLTVEVGASREDVKKDVDKLKTDFPQLFEPVTPPPSRRTSTDPARKQGGQKLDETAMDRGAARAKQRYEQTDAVPRPAIPGVPVT